MSRPFGPVKLLMETVTYFITDLPQFTSLAPCAASGLSYAVQGVSSTNPLENRRGIFAEPSR